MVEEHQKLLMQQMVISLVDVIALPIARFDF
jgi:hypothetical protein